MAEGVPLRLSEPVPVGVSDSVSDVEHEEEPEAEGEAERLRLHVRLGEAVAVELNESEADAVPDPVDEKLRECVALKEAEVEMLDVPLSVVEKDEEGAHDLDNDIIFESVLVAVGDGVLVVVLEVKPEKVLVDE